MELEKTLMIISLVDAATMSFQQHRRTDCHQFLQKGKQVYTPFQLQDIAIEKFASKHPVTTTGPRSHRLLGGLITIVVCCSCISFPNPWFHKKFFVFYPIRIWAFGGLTCTALLWKRHSLYILILGIEIIRIHIVAPSLFLVDIVTSWTRSIHLDKASQ